MEKYRIYKRSTCGADVVQERMYETSNREFAKGRIENELESAKGFEFEYDYTFNPLVDEWYLLVTWNDGDNSCQTIMKVNKITDDTNR